MRIECLCTVSLSLLLWLPGTGGATELGTRQQTILPLVLSTNTTQVCPSNVPLYAVYGYSSWTYGPGENQGRKFDLLPAGYTGAPHAARLLSFFSISDIHITDKESPAQVPYYGWSAPFGVVGPGGLNLSSYSPVMLSTPQVLNATIKTVNRLHRMLTFDFGLSLGDVANSAQHNEIRWFIDVMDGRYITPSSGAHLGADSIGYQKPFQAAGLDRSIPWYEVIGNHDQFWMGIGYPTEKLRNTFVGSNVLNMGAIPLVPNASEASGVYMGVIDGSTPYGDVIKGGPTNLFDTPPTVVADTNRFIVTADVSSPTGCVREFFDTTSLPVGHGFNATNTGSTAACYSFEPRSDLPLKVIVLDNTCKSNSPGFGPTFYGAGWMDASRLAWLTNELQMGQDSNQLMIIACHIPVSPQADLFDTAPSTPTFYQPQTETNLLAMLHQYPNLVLLMAGHRHLNVVTPQPSPDPAHPEYGFWEVETPSLRDFPQQFRTWEIFRNSDNTVSIMTTDIDADVEPGTPEYDSRGYAVGTDRVFGVIPLSDTTSRAYNVELVKPLSAAMQARIAGYNAAPGRRLAIESGGNGLMISFLGQLQFADSLLGPWTPIQDAASPYPVADNKTARFYRTVEVE